MSDVVSYRVSEGVAEITMDDGRVNALSFDMFAGLATALDQAAADGSVVVLAGRPGRFSAGFDLNVLLGSSEDAVDLVRSGFEIAHRFLSHPRPVVAACTGHAVAMGLFLLLSTDLRIGAAGARHRLVANEVAIGLTMPRTALAICRHRIDPRHFDNVVLLAEEFDPRRALSAGLLDAVVEGEGVVDEARRKARKLAELDPAAFAETKLRARGDLLADLRVAIEEDATELRQRAA